MRLSGCAFFCAGLISVAASTEKARADTIALWLFDEPGGLSAGAVLADASSWGHALTLEGGVEIAGGKFGRALRFTDGAARVQGPRGADLGAGKLNLGARDWTIECWLQLDVGAREEGAIFEMGVGAREESALVTRFSVLPRENAFAFTGVVTREDASGEATTTIELPNPAGPPAISARVFTVTLALGSRALPRGAWFHVALVHRAAGEELRLFLDGKPCAVARVRMDALPSGSEAYAVIGRDGRGVRGLRGALDELRLSDAAVYAGEFDPPASFAGSEMDRRQAAPQRSQR